MEHHSNKVPNRSELSWSNRIKSIHNIHIGLENGWKSPGPHPEAKIRLGASREGLGERITVSFSQYLSHTNHGRRKSIVFVLSYKQCLIHIP